MGSKQFAYGITLSIMFLFCQNKISAQPAVISGLEKERPSKIDSLTLIKFEADKGGLPEAFNLLDISPNCLDQGSVNACCGMAIAHAYQIMHYHFTMINGDAPENTIFSGSFIYNQIKNGNNCIAKAFLTDGLDLVAEIGICPTQYFPNDPHFCSKQPNAAHLKHAAEYKISGYGRIINEKMKEDPDEVITQIQSAIYYKNPVIIGVLAPEKFLHMENCSVWIKPEEDKKDWRRHAMVIAAYDANYFQLLNSRGPAWACNCTVQVKHLDLVDIVEQAFIMFPPEN